MPGNTDWASKFDPNNQPKQAVSPTIALLPPKPAEKPQPAQKPGPEISPAGQDSMKRILVVAKKHCLTDDSAPWGHCYAYVYNYIRWTGYGKMKMNDKNDLIPGDYGEVAAQFAEYANGHLDALGLQRLEIDSPYDAPAGAIVVVAAGSPGCSTNESHWEKHPEWKKHPTWPGDISVVSGDGTYFYNDHNHERYGGPAGWNKALAAGTAKLLGAYVPK